MSSESLLLPFTILASSFLGSWHCAGMCGPFAALTGSRGQLWQYHLGRMLAYVTLGAISGAFGQFIFDSSFVWLKNIGAFLLAGILISMGFQYLVDPSHLANSHSRASRFFSRIYQKLHRFKLARSSFSLGLMTGLLPCMWLYTYVVAAAASKSATAGGLVLFLFWLGGLPALSAVAMMIRPSLLKAHRQKQRIAGLVLVGAGLYALLSHLLFAK